MSAAHQELSKQYCYQKLKYRNGHNVLNISNAFDNI